MSKYAYYNPATGAVLQWIDTDQQAYNLPPAEYLLAVTDAQWDKFSSGPAWVVGDKLTVKPPAPVIDINQLRDAAMSNINAWRDGEERTSIVFEHAARRWDGGKSVRGRLQPTVNVAKSHGLPDGFFWTDADNNDVPVTVDELVQLDDAHEFALVMQGNKIHARQRAMKQAVEQMDADQLAAFEPGWE